LEEGARHCKQPLLGDEEIAEPRLVSERACGAKTWPELDGSPMNGISPWPSGISAASSSRCTSLLSSIVVRPWRGHSHIVLLGNRDSRGDERNSLNADHDVFSLIPIVQ
jgi:hypothetical protein